ncbi:S41 family peptidase [Thermoleophilia bacterium SCSIO 60948]|nr:S41 family peptidase [Thermoleophilia bacterium SCSIO 60948]
MNNGHFRLGVLAGVVAGALLCFGGLWLAGLIETSSQEEYADAQAIIEDLYWKEVDPDTLDEASIRGMVDTLREDFDDPFSHYFSPRDLREFNVSTQGRFSGVGLTVGEAKEGLRVAAIIPDSPAAGSDIREGELITAVDGESVAGVPSQTAIAQIKGPEGSFVELTVRAPDGEERQVELERAEVRLPAVDGEIEQTPDGEDVAYVRFSTFSSGAHAELGTEIRKLQDRGAEGLVLDMRGNGGGQLDEAILCASLFLEEGDVVVSTESRTQGDEVLRAGGGQLDPGPMVVLTDEATASSSEILTSALVSYDVAETVGTRTFGKGVFQQVIDLPQGGALDITVGEYLTADGESLAGKGIPPDHKVADDGDPAGPDAVLDEGLRVLDREL